MNSDKPTGTGPMDPTDPTALPLFAPSPSRNGQGATPEGSTAAGAGAWTPAKENVQSRDSDKLDWLLIASLRQQASNRLSEMPQDERSRLGPQDLREKGRAIILGLLEDESAARVTAGEESWSLPEQRLMAKALEDALFGLGRLQPLVDDTRVENITIIGHDRVTLELTDGQLVPGPPVADSDQELIDFLVFLASRSEVNARPFSEAQPSLHLRLDGGARLAAAAFVTPRPQVVIRRHGMREVTLEDFVADNRLSPVAASFLRAAVRARKSIVVSGAQGAGKTTMVRALCAEIPAHEAIGTFETEYELHLHELPERHPLAMPWEARPGSGERGPDGRQAGEYTLATALYDSFRFNLSRQIVGEVRGHEVLAMLKAMESGAGSISTTHAKNAEGAIGKLVTCAMEAGAHVTHEYAMRSIAANIDVIVHVHLETTPLPDGTAQRDRWVSEIITVDPGEREPGYAVNTAFRTEGDARMATPHVLPDDYRELKAWGFDLDGYFRGDGGTS